MGRDFDRGVVNLDLLRRRCIASGECRGFHLITSYFMFILLHPVMIISCRGIRLLLLVAVTLNRQFYANSMALSTTTGSASIE